jgi:hypothetical protein
VGYHILNLSHLLRLLSSSHHQLLPSPILLLIFIIIFIVYTTRNNFCTRRHAQTPASSFTPPAHFGLATAAPLHAVGTCDGVETVRYGVAAEGVAQLKGVEAGAAGGDEDVAHFVDVKVAARWCWMFW